MIAVKAVRAVALTVADADRGRDFYCQALGFHPVSDETFPADTYSRLAPIPAIPVRIVTLQLGSEAIELLEFTGLPAKPIPADSQSNDLWFQHIAIIVKDMDLAYGKLRAFPIERISDGPQTLPPDKAIAGDVRAFKFRDCDRHSVEILWFPPGKGPDKWHQPTSDLFLGIDHSAIAVADTDESLRVYQDCLGLDVADSGMNYGAVQAALDGLPEAKVQINSLSAVSGMGIELLDYVQPGTGRPIPNDWQISDLPHRHLVLEVEHDGADLDALKQFGLAIISPGWVELPSAYPFDQGCFVRDPNGHMLLLVK